MAQSAALKNWQLLSQKNFSHPVFLQLVQLNNTTCLCWNGLYIILKREFSLLIMKAKDKVYKKINATLEKVSSHSYLLSPSIPFESGRTVFLFIMFLIF